MTVTIEQVRTALETHLKHWIDGLKGTVLAENKYYLTNLTMMDERRRFMRKNPGFMQYEPRLQVNYDLNGSYRVERFNQDFPVDMSFDVHRLRGISVSVIEKEEAA